MTHQFGGLGLGLSISQSLTKLMNGSIKAYSDGVNLGSTFIVQFPIINMSKSPSQKNENFAMSSENFVISPKKILYIEDNKSTALVMKRFLAKLGHNVTHAMCVNEGD